MLATLAKMRGKLARGYARASISNEDPYPPLRPQCYAVEETAALSTELRGPGPQSSAIPRRRYNGSAVRGSLS